MRRYWLRFGRRPTSLVPMVAALLMVVSPAVEAQEPAPDAQTQVRFIPAENLAVYAEFDGLDAHKEGWQKTAAYRVLNETSVGAMLEELTTQFFTRKPIMGLTPADTVLLLKHVARAGFVIGENKWASPSRLINTFVFRDAFANKEVRPIFARVLQTLPAPGTKSQSVVKAGHKVVTGKRFNGNTFYWWVEESKKADLIVVTGSPDAIDLVLDTIDGKSPSAEASPMRTELSVAQPGFERTGLAYLDFSRASEMSDNAVQLARFEKTGITRIDFVGGFQADALATTSRVFRKKSTAEAGKSAVTSLDKASLPGIPANVVALTALAVNMRSVVEIIRTNDEIGPKFDQMLNNFKQKTKVRFEEDLLDQLGPKVTAYMIPSKAGASALPSGAALLSALSRAAPGVDAIPKMAILIDVANPATVSKSLDEVMGFVNRQLKTTFATPPGPGNEPPPPPPGGGPPRGRGNPPAPEFRVMGGGDDKSYVFSVPPELSNRFPATFRPTIRLGGKQLAIAMSADAARQALEVKGPYTPPSEIAAAFGRLPNKLNWLLVLDPRDTTPEILASLPGKLQAGINMATMSVAPTPAGAPAPKPLVLQVDPGKLPAPADIRKLLFPAIYTIDQDGEAIRFTTREALPPLIDPTLVGFAVRAVMMQLNPNAATANIPAPAPTNEAPPAASPASPPGGAPLNRPRPGKMMQGREP